MAAQPLRDGIGQRSQMRKGRHAGTVEASAESLASENASRLAAVQRADKDIGVLLTELGA